MAEVNKARRPPPEPEAILRGHLSDVQAVAFGRRRAEGGGRLLFSGDADGEVKAWDLSLMRPVCSLRAAGAAVGVTSLTTSPTGEQLLRQTREGAVEVLECDESGQLSRSPSTGGSIDTEAYNFCRVSVLWGGEEDGTRREEERLRSHRPLLATAGGDPAVAELWDLESRERLLQFALPGNPHGMCMALQLFRLPRLTANRETSATYLIVGYEDGTVALWDCEPGVEPLAIIPHLHSEPLMSLAIDSTAEGAVSCSADNLITKLSIRISDCDGAQKEAALRVVKSAELPTAGAASVAIRHDRKVFAVGAWSGDVWVFSYKKVVPLARLQYHAAGVTHVAFTDAEDGVLVSASRDTTMALWCIYPPSTE